MENNQGVLRSRLTLELLLWKKKDRSFEQDLEEVQDYIQLHSVDRYIINYAGRISKKWGRKL
jgi:hypothetical protein|tara:strand:- start:389 stop:574 length:186 start_codon:yes stop_codon:yes gene_type:complete